MKSYILWYCISLISLNGLSHAEYHLTLQKRFKRTDEASTQLGLGMKEKESFQEALEILNMGKQSLNLPTEDTQLLLQLADASSNDTDKSGKIEKFVEGASDDNLSSNGKQYLALSGNNGQVHVDNFSIVTTGPEGTSTNNNVEVQDVFKMVVQKKIPNSNDNAVHKISILETNRVEPILRMEYPHSKRRRKDVWILPELLGKSHVRQKRARDDPLLRFIRGDFSADDIDEIFSDKDTSGRHTIKIRNLLEKGPLRENNHNSKRAYDDHKSKGHGKNKIHETFSPWMRSQYKIEPLNHFHTKSGTLKHRKFRIPLNDFQSSNWHVWRGLSNSKSRMDDEYVDDVFKINNVDKTEDTDTPLHSEGLGQYFGTTKEHIPKSETTKASIPKRSLVEKSVSSVKQKSNTSTLSYTTGGGTTLQHEKTSLIPEISIDKYAFEKAIIFPSEGSMTETKSTSISDVAIVVFICLLCFATIFLVFSTAARWHTQKTCCSTLELRGAQVTVNIHDDSSPDNFNMRHQLPFKSHSGMYYRKMAGVQDNKEGDFDLPDFEWQSELGEWLSDQGSVRHAIGFEEL